MQSWQPSAPVRADERAPYNSLAAIALAITFVTIIGGIVCGHVALSQIARTGERGRWLAVTALVIGYSIVGFFAVLLLTVAGAAVSGLALR